MTERCKRNPCCGDYLDCKPPPQFKPRESHEEYEQRTARPSSPVVEGVREAVLTCDEAVRVEIARLRSHYQSNSALDHGRRQMLDHFDMFLAALSPSDEPMAYASPEQIADLQDRPGDDLGGVYIPLRKVPAGLFQMPLYAHPALAAVEKPPQVRHLKRGSTYDVLGEGEVQISIGVSVDRGMGLSPVQGSMVLDGDTWVAYRAHDTGKLYFRRPAELNDPARFERLPA